MRQVRFALRSYRTEFEKAYGKEEGEAIARESLQRFEVLLPDLPCIGGDENRLSKALYITASMLAMYRSLQARAASVEEVARLIWQRVRHAAAVSQQRRYPDDWVFEVISGRAPLSARLAFHAKTTPSHAPTA